jgi:uroporphyrinogen-III synthase
MDKMSTEVPQAGTEVMPFVLRSNEIVNPGNTLQGKKIVFTRGIEQDISGIQPLIDAGAEVILFPVLKFSALPIPDAIRARLRQKFYDYIVLTSVNAVTFFLSALSESEFSELHEMRFVAIGEKTAGALAKHGFTVWHQGTGKSATALLQEIASLDCQNKQFLLPGSKIGRTELFDGLRAIGALPERVFIYDTIAPAKNEISDIIRYVEQSVIDCFLFTSPSAFDNYLSLLAVAEPETYFSQSLVSAIGTTTADHLCKSGIPVVLLPEQPKLLELSQSIIDFYNNNEMKK